MAEDGTVPPEPGTKEDTTTNNTVNAENMHGAAIGHGASVNYGIKEELFLKFLNEERESNHKLWRDLLGLFGTRNGAGPGGKRVEVGNEFFESLNDERKQVSEENETQEAASSIADQVELHETLEEIERWYYETLTDYERCFVQALTILYGAPIIEIAAAAGQLYQTIKETEIRHRKEGHESETSPKKIPNRRELLTHTLATTKRVNYVDRTFWRNNNLEEQQKFTTRMLRFLADEAAASFNGEPLIDITYEWAEKMTGECARKAAYAVGVMLYYQSVEELSRRANTWANSTNIGDRYRAASILHGGYDADKLENAERATNSQKSPVFRLLDQWVERAKDARNPRVGSAAANAYRVMSREVPEYALNGLESLLCLPRKVDTNWQSISVSVWAESISAYVSVAWSGQVRQVLKHLADYAELLVYQRQRPDRIDERSAYYERRKLNLAAIFDIFFFVASFSLIRAQITPPVHYSLTDPLPEQPDLSDEHERDILLAGILSEEEFGWRGQLATLFCAAIFAMRTKEAFFFMQIWANIVLQAADDENEPLRQRYLQFIVDVGNMVKKWDNDLTAMRLGTPVAYHAFMHELKLWKMQYSKQKDREQNLDRQIFIQDVLDQLSS